MDCGSVFYVPAFDPGHDFDKRTYISKMWTLSAVLDILGYQAEFKERDEKYGTEYDCFTIIECKKANKEK